MSKYDFKYIVIGSGPAGATAALTLAKARKKVALVEGQAFGGTSLATREIPYAVTLDFAHNYYRFLRQPEVSCKGISVSFPSVVAHQMKAVVESSAPYSAKNLEKSGLICIKGFATFLDPHTIAVGKRKFSSEYFILATGAQISARGINGLDSVPCLTPDNALKIRRLPQAAIVIGGGATGCELAEYYATLGIKTLIAEQAGRLLPHEDPDISAAMAKHLESDLKITVLTSSKITTIGQDDTSKYIIFESEKTEKMVRVDCIILATGSRPVDNYGLATAGVQFNKSGFIKTNTYFQTSAKHIYAIGDCADYNSSTARAEYQGRLIANNFTDKTRSMPNYTGFPRTVNTLPAVVTFGDNESQLRRAKKRHHKGIIQLADTPAGKVNGTKLGFVKVITDYTGHIVAGAIVSDHAEAMSGELALAIRHRLTALELASTPHSIYDFSHALTLAAKKLVR